jgi:predicted NUDIX family phosphoesterase
MENMAAEERVLCFKRELFEQLGVFQGLSLDVEKYLPVVTAAANTTYLNRSEAELDRRYKQLIPYVLIICNDKILRYRRGKGGGEKRLHGFYSVGIGGHISDVDIELFSKAGYQEGMRRELMEEVAIENDKDAAVAAINDDSTDVGHVHFGVVHVLSVANEDVAGHRSGILAPEFVPIAEAVKSATEYESWSQFCLQNIDSLLARAAAVGIAVPERVVN